jgi:hypothetical protein
MLHLGYSTLLFQRNSSCRTTDAAVLVFSTHAVVLACTSLTADLTPSRDGFDTWFFTRICSWWCVLSLWRTYSFID